jgi:hypothetical protein
MVLFMDIISCAGQGKPRHVLLKAGEMQRSNPQRVRVADSDLAKENNIWYHERVRASDRAKENTVHGRQGETSD